MLIDNYSVRAHIYEIQPSGLMIMLINSFLCLFHLYCAIGVDSKTPKRQQRNKKNDTKRIDKMLRSNDGAMWTKNMVT